ncbi:MAG TPA: 3'-5' exonuclease [Bacteroidia bacterium]|nr:3'-5' exonuclease [Bacteroidia bacterium]HNT79530.1 3'-5' exonuclease [Bacteroidia bacterium]
MLESALLHNIVFLDIETVPQHASYDQLDETEKKMWERKSSYLKKSEEDSDSTLYHRAGIYAEFGKIICISIGYFKSSSAPREFRITSFYGHDEKKLLEKFAHVLTQYFNRSSIALCAHNGKEFDFPYLCRRMIIHRIPLPSVLDISGKKPWEINHLDTMELWKFGDYKNYTPLNLLTHILGIPSPKDDIDGSMVREVYYAENNLERIMEYCQKDVVAVAQIILRLKGETLLNAEEIHLINQ